MLEDIRNTVKDSFIYGIGNLATKIVGFILIPIYTNSKFLSVDDYGVMSIVDVTSQIFIQIMGLTLYAGLFRWYWDKEFQHKQKEFFTTCFILTTLAVLFFTIPLLGYTNPFSQLLFDTSDYSYLLKLVIVSSALQALMNIPNALLRLEHKTFLFTLLHVLKFVIILSLTIYFVVFKKIGVVGVYWAQIGGGIINLVLLIPFLKQHLVWRIDKNSIGAILHYAYPLMFAAISVSLMSAFDRYSLNELKNLTDVGVYSLGFRYANTIQVFIISSVMLALSPLMMKKISDKNCKRFYSKVLTYFAFGLMIIILGFSLYAKELVLFTVVDEVYFEAATIIPIIALTFFFSMMRDINLIGLQIVKKTSIIGSTVVMITILNFVLNLLLIPCWGIYGASSATLIAQIFYWLFVYLYAQHYYKIKYEMWKVAKVLILGIVFYFVGVQFNEFNLLLGMLLKLILIFLFPLFLYLWNFFDPIELVRLKDIWKKWRNINKITSNLKINKF